MTRKDASLRLFLAVYPPPALVDRWQESLRRLNLPAHRETPREQVHLTLHFIGDCMVRSLEGVKESVHRAAGGIGKFAMHPQTLITLPERGPARLVAIETDAPGILLELQRRLVQRLARNARSNPSKKFRPHLTLCRFRSPTRLPRMEVAQADEPFDVHEMLLMKSVLKLSGAVHDVVERFPLIGS